MEDNDEGNIQESEESAFKKISRFGNKLMETLFAVFYALFKDYNTINRFETQTTKLYVHMLYSVTISLQVLSLTFPPNLDSWDSFHLISAFVGYSRFDYLVANLGFGVPFWYVALGVVGFAFLIFLFLYFKIYFQYKIKESNYRYILGSVLKIFRLVLFLPFMNIFISVQKYSYKDKTSVFEYGGLSSSNITANYTGFLSALAEPVLVLLVLMDAGFNYEQYITRHKSMIYARAHSRVEECKILLLALLCYSHWYLHKDYYAAHLLISLAIGVILSSAYLYFLPFYTIFVNFTSSSCYLLLTWSSIAQLIGLWFDNATLVFYFIILVYPCLELALWEILHFRINWLMKNYDKIIYYSNPYVCEIIVRFEILKLLALNKKTVEGKSAGKKIRAHIHSLHREIANRFENHFFCAIWEFLYVYIVLKKDGLAKIKLTKTIDTQFSLEGAYLKYKYSNTINDFRRKILEEIDYINFRKLYEDALMFDKEACQDQLDFWNEMSAEAPQIHQIEKIGYKLFKTIQKAKKFSKNLIKQYPTNQQALRIYGTFLLEVYNNTVKGNELVSRAEHEKLQQEQKNAMIGERFNYFDENNGIIIVSGSPDDMGNITNMNTQAGNLLGVPTRYTIGQNIANYIPPPGNQVNSHNRAMEEYLKTTTTTEVCAPFNIIMLDAHGYLIECYYKGRAVALDSYPFFLSAIKKNSQARECLLYDDSNMITVNTRGMARLLGYSEEVILLNKLDANKVINNFDSLREKYPPGTIFEYMIPGIVNSLTMRFTDLKIGKVTFKMLHVTSDEDEVKSWKINKETTSFEDLRDLGVIEQTQEVKKKEKRGILKEPRQKSDKNCNVTFDISPQIFEIGETDFKAGKNVAGGKVKDATTSKQPVKLSEEKVEEDDDEEDKSSEKEETKNAPIPQEGQIFDLKDLGGFLFNNSEKPGDAASVVSFSVIEEDITKKRSGTSIASSAVSSNASFTSSQEAQVLLTGVTSSMFRFKVAFFATCLIVNLAALSMMIYLEFISTKYLESVIINDLAERRTLNTYFSLDARTLHLINLGELPPSMESASRERLLTGINRYNEIIDNIKSNLKGWKDGKAKDMYQDSQIKSWELKSGVINSTDVNLMDAMRDLVSQALMLYNTPLNEIDAQNPNFFYIYRNSYGETMQGLNISIEYFIDDAEENMQKFLEVILILASCAVALMFICFFLVIIPTLRQVEKSNQTVWSLFYLLPIDLVLELKSRCEERLEQTHGIESDKKNDKNKFKSLEERSNIKATNKWKGILVRLTVYYLFSAAFFLFFYFIGYETFGNTLEIKPKINNWAGMRTSAANAAFYWLQEVKYANLSYGYKWIVPYSQYEISPDYAFIFNSELMVFSEYNLLFRHLSSLKRSSKHNNYIWDDACLSEQCITLSKGYYASLNEYYLGIRDVYWQIVEGKNTSLDSISETKEELVEIGTTLIDLYESDIKDMIKKDAYLVIWISSSYCFIVFILYFFVYVRELNKVQQQITNIWSLGRLIPIDHRNKIMRSLRAHGKLQFQKK
ncbi:unnamed protein product [Blepharisma stoltei]|uniref:TmcB/TmcC TPR repeats domain-containing protein n=1 Tax=Blepharisma stoltei TaxID=1481888 RepID=A0AAU9JLM1_9CILI|nr:unnamed protein product [Blepharisma stoltei]